MFAIGEGVQAVYDNGKTYTGPVEKVRIVNGRTLITIAIPTRDYDNYDRPVNVWEYRSIYLDKCVSIRHVDPQEV